MEERAHADRREEQQRRRVARTSEDPARNTERMRQAMHEFLRDTLLKKSCHLRQMQISRNNHPEVAHTIASNVLVALKHLRKRHW